MKGSRQTRQTLDRLRRYESRNVTFLAPDGRWPIVWAEARGCQVRDADGRRYLDLTAAFGVAAAGHAHPPVVRAGQQQMSRLLHAMGDVHPHALKADLARALSARTFERWTTPAVQPGPEPAAGRDARRAATPARANQPAPAPRFHGKCIFGNSGFEAVEAALKTARLVTGRPGVLAFEGGYHGLGYGALNVTHRAHFREPFRDQLREFGRFLPFPADAASLHQTLRRARTLLAGGRIGAVLVEPMQARGGIRIPPAGFLRALRDLCTTHGALLVLDEIYTGFGRTGRWFACEHDGVVPDVICLGKALTGGFPLSATVGRADLMDAWPPSSGEAIHTSTYLGHPVGCAMALAQIAEIDRLELPARSARLGARLLERLHALAERFAAARSGPRPRPARLQLSARGLGLMAGLEIRDRHGQPAVDATLELLPRLLRRGFIFLPEGDPAHVLAWTPPLTIPARDLDDSVEAVGAELARPTLPLP